jgi:hypothetical protein
MKITNSGWSTNQTLAFGSHASGSDLTSHLNARPVSRVSLASNQAAALAHEGGLMLSQNPCDLLPERACLAALVVLAQRGGPPQ